MPNSSGPRWRSVAAIRRNASIRGAGPSSRTKTPAMPHIFEVYREAGLRARGILPLEEPPLRCIVGPTSRGGRLGLLASLKRRWWLRTAGAVTLGDDVVIEGPVICCGGGAVRIGRGVQLRAG